MLNNNHQIKLTQNYGFQWLVYSKDNIEIWFKGFAFYEESFLELSNLVDLVLPIVDNSSWDKLSELIKNMNGSFALVIKTEQVIVAAVDRLRSIPLFYGEHQNILYLSDDAHWVREKVRDTEMNDLNVTEFLLTAYVTGQETLFPNLKQIQAGEILLAKQHSDLLKIDTQRYYRFIHGNYFDASEEELCSLMDTMLLGVFQRLLKSIGNRTVVIPLSGGYDSRLIVTMLKRLGKENVICFSYGRKGNWEANISKQVADTLGYPWYFVPYSRQSWYEWFNSEEMTIYYKYATGLTSLAHLQDWAAVWKLKQDNKIPNDAVFVPGHSGDFVGGSHIPREFEYKSKISEQRLIENIWKKHYSLWDWSKYFNHLSLPLKNRILSHLSDFSFDSGENAASAFECWDWQERQAKFIVNSVRIYEFWDYEWRIPLWDYEMMEFWERVPLNLRIGKKLYDFYSETIFKKYKVNYSLDDIWNRSIIKISSYFHRFFDVWKCGAFEINPYFPFKKITDSKKLADYNHFLIDYDQYIFMTRNNGILSLYHLNDICKETKN
ncbi:asparagine synthetase B family protein [Rivularia sp. UHCC 0363]|uniref:asparagine synthetase B family protein n=1 Tax=Rivularia sp. UHCC 0363 TaxID=3110244 RepID=UPI002B214270|nr:asparagine synthetase B family protein [Rivularia sp. UHCC 0363]MEA5598798.1 asparagine synthetase B family protein [Rivularia sp. UHCC 0363]